MDRNISRDRSEPRCLCHGGVQPFREKLDVTWAQSGIETSSSLARCNAVPRHLDLRKDCDHVRIFIQRRAVEALYAQDSIQIVSRVWIVAFFLGWRVRLRFEMGQGYAGTIVPPKLNMPKSETHTRPAFVTRILWGLTSRCKTS